MLTARPILGPALALLLFASILPGQAESVRVASWTMEPLGAAPDLAGEAFTTRARIQEAAKALKQSNPDIILLQRVRDWQMCAQLAQALQPTNYIVLICSAFRDTRTGLLSPDQVAILSKRRGYFSWSGVWRPKGEAPVPGGYAFAAVQWGSQRVGYFAVQLSEPLAPPAGGGPDAARARIQAACIDQWIEEVGKFRSWVTNRIDAAVIAGGFGTSSTPPPAAPETPWSQERARFAAAFLEAALDQPQRVSAPGEPATSTETMQVHVVANLSGLSGVVLDHFPETCELTIDPPLPTAAPTAMDHQQPSEARMPASVAPGRAESTNPSADLTKGESRPPNELKLKPVKPPIAGVLAISQPRKGRLIGWIGGGLGGLAVILALTWWLTRRQRTKATATAGKAAVEKAESGISQTSAGATITSPPASPTVAVTPASPTVALKPGSPSVALAPAGPTVALKPAGPTVALKPTSPTVALPPASALMSDDPIAAMTPAKKSSTPVSAKAAPLEAMDVDKLLAGVEQQKEQPNSDLQKEIDELTKAAAAKPADPTK